MAKRLITLVCVLALTLGAAATDAKDFVTLLIEQAEAESEESTKDYEYTQIGPSMIALMKQMVDSSAGDRLSDEERETMTRLLSQISSICIFRTTSRHDFYYGLAKGLIEAQGETYEDLATSNGANGSNGVWCRRGSENITELFAINYEEGTALNIVGFTGDIDKDLLTTLMDVAKERIAK